MTVVAYPKKEARTCMNAREVMAPAKTVKRGFFMALEVRNYINVYVGYDRLT